MLSASHTRRNFEPDKDALRLLDPGTRRAGQTEVNRRGWTGDGGWKGKPEVGSANPSASAWNPGLDHGSGGSSGFDSDSAPSSNCGSCPPSSSSRHISCPDSCLPPPSRHSSCTCAGNKPSSSDFSRLGARPKRMPVEDRLSPELMTPEETDSSSCSRRVPDHSRNHSQHSGLSDAGYHSLVPSRSPTASYSTSSLDNSSIGLVGSNVWNVRATSDNNNLCPPLSPPRRPKAGNNRRCATPQSGAAGAGVGKSKKPVCHLDRLTDSMLVNILSYLTSVDIISVSRTCKRLYFLAWEPDLWTSLSLTSPTIETDRAIKSVLDVLARNSGLSSVRSVCLNGSTRLTDRGLALVARRAGQLRQLEVQHCPGVTNGGLLDLVSKCPQLVHLDLTGCPMVTTVSLPSPATRGRPSLSLQYLDLSDCSAVDDTSVRLAVENCPSLQYLFLRRCTAISDVSLKCISSYCLMLRELSISDCTRITDTGLTHLAKLGPSLRYLSVAKCHQLTDNGVKQVARHCYKLRYLNLRGCEMISDLAVDALSRSCSRLRSLDIGKCDVTDLGLRDLSINCPNLKKLSVRGCEMVTDQGLTNVAYYCRGLQQLNIQDVLGVTTEGYRNVKKYCRKCIIEHTNPGLG